MDFEKIAIEIVQAVKENSEESGGNPLENFQDQHSDYLLEFMPYDVRILERRNEEAEEKVRFIVERILEQQQAN